MPSDVAYAARRTERDGPPLASVHTTSLPELLDRLGISVLVSTYQAGKLIVVRSEGGRVNTHFRNFQTPMGLALLGDRLAIGTRTQVLRYQNQPAVAPRLPPAARPHDACFVPRTAHTTGNIGGHELAFVGGDAVGRQHPLLLPLHSGPGRQLRPALAAAIHLRSGPRRPLPPECPRRPRRGDPLRHRPGRNR